MINHMLDDGLPYRVLIDELGEAGEGLNTQKLADWVQGRYQDYVKDCQTIEQAKTRMEFASDLIRELGATDPALIYRACSTVAALQILEAIQEYGDEALRQLLNSKPTSYITLLNGLCNLTNTELKRDEVKLSS